MNHPMTGLTCRPKSDKKESTSVLADVSQIITGEAILLFSAPDKKG